jgi:hypothetical protein
MKYWAPINSPGGINGNDSYVNANPSIGVQGSIPTFQSFEQTLRGLQNLVLKSNLTPNSALDDLQVAQSVRAQWLNWAGVFAGTANALTCVLDPTPASLAELVGVPIRGIGAFYNTGPSTLVVSGLTAAPITLVDGTPLAGREIRPGAILELVYDGTKFQLTNSAVGGSSLTPWTNRMPGFFWGNAPTSPTTGWFTSLTPNVWTKVNAKVEYADVEGWYDAPNSRYQPQKPGYFFICGDCSFGTNTSGWPTCGLRAFKNGVPAFHSNPDDVAGAQFGTQNNGARAIVSGITVMNGTTDYIEMYAYQDFPDSTLGAWRAYNLRFGGWFVGAL